MILVDKNNIEFQLERQSYNIKKEEDFYIFLFEKFNKSKASVDIKGLDIKHSHNNLLLIKKDRNRYLIVDKEKFFNKCYNKGYYLLKDKYTNKEWKIQLKFKTKGLSFFFYLS